MISLYKYHLNYRDTGFLIEELRKDHFLKTEIDVVYDDFVRWEKNNLLWTVDNLETNAHRKYSYIEYTWVKMIEQLRTYGFSYEKIAEFRPFLTQILDNDLLKEAYEAKSELAKEVLTTEELSHYNKTKELDNISEVINISIFELVIISAITFNDSVSILFYNDMPGYCFPISEELHKEMENDPDNSEMIELLEKTHLSISITQIIRRYVKNDLPKSSKSDRFKSILSTEEHKLLKVIRKDYKNLKSITIKYKSNKINMLEVKTTKKAKAESRLLEHINKGDYSTIQIESVDGNIVNFENTQKYKL